MTFLISSRDPCGSRGSKYYVMRFGLIGVIRRDPCGSRGSKFKFNE